MTELKNKIYIDKNWGLFLGAFNENKAHKHYAVQLSISINEKIEFNKSVHFENCLIKSNEEHQLSCQSDHLLFLFNPTSSIGHYLSEMASDNIIGYNHPITDKLKNSATCYLGDSIEFQTFIKDVKVILNDFECKCENDNHFKDDRILDAIKYIEKNSDRVIPLAEIAAVCFLSPSRFLHLFKEKTGLTYRRAQLWFKISQSFPFLSKQSITQTAYQFGFTDSAHYSKVFKQNFGFSPKRFSKK